MPKESYDTDVKRKAIEEQRNLIKNFLIKKNKGKPEELRVAFFPGAEALEYKLAYGPLGIPQENITAIERYKPHFDYWKNNSSFSMTDKPVEALDFFKNYRGKPFDIISLDYDGMLDKDNVETFLKIVDKQMLSNKSVFTSNLYAKREGKKTKDWYNTILAAKTAGQFAAKDDKMDKRMLEIAKNSSTQRKNFLGTFQENVSAKKIIDQIEDNFDLDYRRDRGILELLAIGFSFGKTFATETMPPLYFKDPIHKEWEHQLEKFIKKMPKEEIENLGGLGGENLARRQLRGLFIEPLISRLHEYLVENGHTPKIASILSLIDKGVYFPIEIKSCSYISENGAIMHTDLFCLDQKKEILDKYQKMYDTLYTPKFRKGPFPNIIIRVKNRTEAKNILKEKNQYENKYERISKSLDTLQYIENLPQRKFLGSSQRPLIRSKDKLREIVQSGLSKEEIETQYKISEDLQGSLPALIAHRTIGTYEKPLEDKQTNEKPHLIKQEPKKQEKLEEKIFSKGIIVFDSNSHRLQKNLERVNFGKNEVKTTSVVHGFKENPGILMMEKQYGLYVVNTNDINAQQVVSELALRYCESNRYLNLLLIGNPDLFSEDISVARELGAKINVSGYKTNNGYIDVINHLSLESLVSDIPMQVVKKPEKIKEEPKLEIKQPSYVVKQTAIEDNQQIFTDLLAGMSDEEVMNKYNIPKTKLAGKKMVLTKRGMW